MGAWFNLLMGFSTEEFGECLQGQWLCLKLVNLSTMGLETWKILALHGKLYGIRLPVFSIGRCENYSVRNCRIWRLSQTYAVWLCILYPQEWQCMGKGEHAKCIRLHCHPPTHTYTHLNLNFPLVIVSLNHLKRESWQKEVEISMTSLWKSICKPMCSFKNVKLEIKPNQRRFMNDLLKICVAVVTLVVIFGRGIIGNIW